MFVSPFRPTHQNRRDPKNVLPHLMKLKKKYSVHSCYVYTWMRWMYLITLLLNIYQQTSTLVKNNAYEEYLFCPLSQLLKEKIKYFSYLPTHKSNCWVGKGKQTMFKFWPEAIFTPRGPELAMDLSVFVHGRVFARISSTHSN